MEKEMIIPTIGENEDISSTEYLIRIARMNEEKDGGTFSAKDEKEVRDDPFFLDMAKTYDNFAESKVRLFVTSLSNRDDI